jgi:hypothetical protein
MIPLRSQAEAETLAALDGIVAALDGPPLPPELALVPFRIYGDALRLGLETPKAVRSWAAARSPSALDDVLRAALPLLEVLSIPAGSEPAQDPTVPTRLRERDHVESVIHAVRRVWLPRPLAQLEAHAALVARLAEVDKAYDAALSRSDVTALLGVRAGLGARWAQAFHDEGRALGDEDRLLGALRGALPSPAFVASYVESGAMQSFVEQAAAADADFAEELSDTIEAMRLSGHAGFLARAWQKNSAASRAKGAALAFAAPALSRAAASGDEGSPLVTHRLGALFGGAGIEASLTIGGTEICLDADFDAGTIASVELGADRVVPRDDETSCHLVVARSSDTLVLRVCTRSGQEICEELSIDAGAS